MSGPPLYAWSVEHTRTPALEEFFPNFPTIVTAYDSRKPYCLQNQVSSQKKKSNKQYSSEIRREPSGSRAGREETFKFNCLMSLHERQCGRQLDSLTSGIVCWLY